MRPAGARAGSLLAGGMAGTAGAASGRTSSTRVPWPTSLSTSMRPPWVVMMPWQTARPRPVPTPLGLGGEEGLEGPAQHLGRHPGPVVGDREPHGVVRRLGPELEPPLTRALLERLLGVDHQVGDDLVQLVGVAVDRRQAARHVHHHPHAARAQRVAGELQGTLDRGREVHRAEAWWLLPRHGEEALDDPGAPLGRGVDPLGLLARLAAAPRCA